jgi:nuclear receptor subfamily 1 group F protein 4
VIIQKLNERIHCALKLELGKSHPDDEQLRIHLQQKLPMLQLLNYRHTDLLAKFKEEHPDIDFPALHKELFSQDGLDDQI